MSSLLFLGTAGGRVLVFRQLRASGGLWLESNGTNILIDPGPGALIRCLEHNLNPQELDVIILTHKHLDHSGDVNIMIEAISEGGIFPRGTLLAPKDCFDDDPVVLKYNRKYLDDFIRITPGFKFEINDVKIEFPIKLHHTVDTFGYKISNKDFTLSHIADTRYFDELIPAYKNSDILIMNMTFDEPRPELQHLSFNDVMELVDGIQPELAIITHFGYKLWQNGAEKCIDKIKQVTGVRVIEAIDNLTIDLENRSYRQP